MRHSSDLLKQSCSGCRYNSQLKQIQPEHSNSPKKQSPLTSGQEEVSYAKVAAKSTKSTLTMDALKKMISILEKLDDWWVRTALALRDNGNITLPRTLFITWCL